jgi:hypothetical protein
VWPFVLGLGQVWPFVVGLEQVWPFVVGLEQVWPFVVGLGHSYSCDIFSTNVFLRFDFVELCLHSSRRRHLVFVCL